MSLQVLINNLTIVCPVGRNCGGMGPTTIILPVKPFPRGEEAVRDFWWNYKYQRRANSSQQLQGHGRSHVMIWTMCVRYNMFFAKVLLKSPPGGVDILRCQTRSDQVLADQSARAWLTNKVSRTFPRCFCCQPAIVMACFDKLSAL